MAKREAITRYNLIINKVRKHPASFVEIKRFIENHFENEELTLKFSKRTFHRDLAEIASLYNIEIKYNTQKQGYEVVHEDDTNSTHHILEAFDVFNALNIRERLSDYIHFENRKPKGTEHIHGILHAIKNRRELEFNYHSFWYNSPSQRRIQPLALKEFKNRWYVVSLDTKDFRIKTFGLDRIADLEISRQKFVFPADFNIIKHYEHCFGIISPDDLPAEEVILSFHPHKGKYIKSLPLHESQEVLVDNENELRVKLTVYVTFDFEMEILSHGDQVAVIAPQSLVSKIKFALKQSLKHYE
ncbi:helix-turn-helix transcriptional regulator [Roseimarinus sediminis]|uniref:helix-turn-helix transcriptional regulator n=1 Tax=Roseimarinus sediminis TaxID=1610899 RepID=UPI003D1EDEFB